MANKDSEQMVGPEGPRSWVPIPDPTILTTQAQERAVTQSRRELEALEALLNFRIDRLRADLDAVPLLHDQSVAHAIELVDEKFRGIEQRFRDRDARAQDAATASKEALTAAFTAAKELSGLVAEQFKSEITSLRQAADERAKSQDLQFQTLKERIDRGEGQGQGAREVRVDQREETRTRTAANGVYIAAAAAMISVGAIVVAIILALALHK